MRPVTDSSPLSRRSRDWAGWKDVGDVCRAWDHATYRNALTARFFATEDRDNYYVGHPKTHECLERGTCDFLK